MADVLLGKTEGIEGFERHVVLKRIRPERARDQHFIKMFLDEARVAASLHHQNIIQVHDIGEADGEYFFAMEYIHGEDLRAILMAHAKQRTHMPLQFVVAVVTAAASGLHHAHERRGTDKRPLHIVHRDVSPSNILVGYDGSIKLFDFGIAKAGTGEDTLAGHLKGKIAYMSPEQVTNGAVDRRSDVYSLGVVLYELATTTRLFRGDSDAAIIDQIVRGRVPLPRVRRPDLTNELSTIIMTALSPDPERRYASADELRAALDEYSEWMGNTVQPAQLASYMRKLFGDKPEPWLDLSSRAHEAVEELMPTSISPRPRQTWTGIELAHGSTPAGNTTHSSVRDLATARGTGEIPRRTGSFAAMDPPAITTDRHIKVHAQLDVVEPSPSWEQKAPASPARVRTKLVLMGAAAAAAIAGVVLFAALRSGDEATVGPSEPSATQHPIVSAIAPAPPVVAPPAAVEPATPSAATAMVKKVAPAPHVAPKTVPSPAHVTDKPRADKPVDDVASRLATIAKSDMAGGRIESKSPATPSVSPTSITPPTVTPSPATTTATPPVQATLASATTPAPSPTTPGAAPTPSPPVAPVSEIPLLAHATIERVAALHGRELSKCEGGDTIHGEVVVKFNVDATGRVQKPQIATRLKLPKLSACILRSIQRWQFPRQGAEGAQGTYTLSFQ